MTGPDRPPGAHSGLPRRAQPAGQLEHDPLRALPADAGHRGQRRQVLGRHRPAQRVGGEHGQHRQGQPGPDSAGGLHQLERVPLVLGAEAVQGQRVLPDHQRGGDPGPLAGAQPGQRARRALHQQPDTSDVDHRTVGRHAGHGPVQVRDHVILQSSARLPRRRDGSGRLPRRQGGSGRRHATGGRSRARARRRRRRAEGGYSSRAGA